MWLSEAHADIPINLMGPNPGPGHGGMSFANPSKPTFSMAWRHNRNAKNAQSRDETSTEFKKRLETDLKRLLRDRIGVSNTSLVPASIPAPIWTGSPYPGLR